MLKAAKFAITVLGVIADAVGVFLFAFGFLQSQPSYMAAGATLVVVIFAVIGFLSLTSDYIDKELSAAASNILLTINFILLFSMAYFSARTSYYFDQNFIQTLTVSWDQVERGSMTRAQWLEFIVLNPFISHLLIWGVLFFSILFWYIVSGTSGAARGSVPKVLFVLVFLTEILLLAFPLIIGRVSLSIVDSISTILVTLLTGWAFRLFRRGSAAFSQST